MDHSMPPPTSRAPPSSYTAPSPSPSTPGTSARKPKKPRKPKLAPDGTPLPKPAPKKRAPKPPASARGGKGPGSSRAGSVIPSRAGSASVYAAGGAFSRAGSLMRGTEGGSVVSRSEAQSQFEESDNGEDEEEGEGKGRREESEEAEDEDEMAGDEQVLWKRQNDKVNAENKVLHARRGVLVEYVGKADKDQDARITATSQMMAKGALDKLLTKLLGQKPNDANRIALQGVGKVYVGEIITLALEVAAEYNQSPPLTPAHLREAQLRYQARLTGSMGRAPGGAGAGGTFGGGGGRVKKRGPFGGC